MQKLRALLFFSVIWVCGSIFPVSEVREVFPNVQKYYRSGPSYCANRGSGVLEVETNPKVTPSFFATHKKALLATAAVVAAGAILYKLFKSRTKKTA